MGYNTNYTLYADSRHEDINNLINTGKTDNAWSYLNSLDYYEGGFGGGEPCWYAGRWKWYEHDDDMKVLSAQFPDVTFCLEGVGEEHPDIWKKHYKNGEIIRSQVGVITFEDRTGNVVHTR